jgi:hypothetical protein
LGLAPVCCLVMVFTVILSIIGVFAMVFVIFRLFSISKCSLLIVISFKGISLDLWIYPA